MNKLTSKGLVMIVGPIDVFSFSAYDVYLAVNGLIAAHWVLSKIHKIFGEYFSKFSLNSNFLSDFDAFEMKKLAKFIVISFYIVIHLYSLIRKRKKQ